MSTQGGVREVEVGPEQSGQRIDNFLTRQLKGVPRSHIYRILRRGEVRVNRGRVRAAYRLQSGDVVRIPPVRTAAPAPRVQADVAWLEQAVLHEDDRLLVLNKPSGMAVHGGSGLSHGVIEALRVLRPQGSLELVHRLDRETSGCLLVAKRRSALRALHEQLRAGEVEKRYLVLVRGRWQAGTRVVDAPLQRFERRGGERHVTVGPAGKAARTRLAPVAEHAEASLLEAVLDTGRTHQIRVHCAHVGHPVAGDDKYGDADFNRAMAARGLRRLFLHAHSLGFRHPATGEPLQVDAPLPDDLRKVMDTFE